MIELKPARVIKFRAWSNTNVGMWEWEDILSDSYRLLSIFENDFNEWIVMQYTGLTDRNGKEIYEGDIVEEHPDYEGDIVEKYTIEWTKAYSGYQFCMIGDDGKLSDFYGGISQNDYFRVIGNIFETPDLKGP